MTWDLLRRSVTHGIVPGLAGGPWVWGRWAPASPWAIPPTTVIALGWLVLAAALAISLARKQRIVPVWLTAAGYVVACQVPIYLMRSSRFTALELAQTLRYLPDLVVVLALLAAVGFCAPNRPSSGWLDVSRARTSRHDRGGGGLRGEQLLLDGDVPDVLAGQSRSAVPAERPARFGCRARDIECAVARPGGRPAGAGAGGLAGQPGQPHVRTTARSTRIQLGDNAIEDAECKGRLVDAQVTWVRAMAPGPIPQCGYLVQPDHPVEIGLDGPLLPTDWTAEINYLANSDGSMTLSLSEGTDTRVPVHPGLNRVLRATTRRGQCHPGAGQHRRAERVHCGGAGGICAAALTAAHAKEWSHLGESNS